MAAQTALVRKRSASSLLPTLSERECPRCFSTSVRRPAKPSSRGPPKEENTGLTLEDMPKFMGDDVPSMAHMKMQDQREKLHYLRLIQFQMPELEKFQRPFRPPSPSHIIRLRTQNYGGEAHPADRKAVIEIPISRVPFSSPEAKHKFILLAGPRWNSEKNEVKISCELFPELKMNEKWCSDTLDKLLKEAEDQTDPMSEIPLDDRPTRVRRAKRGKTLTIRNFPSEWLPRRPATKDEA